jgi:hypothetical protein
MRIELTLDDLKEAVTEYLDKKLNVPCDIKVWVEYDDNRELELFYFNIETIKKEDEKDGSL